MDSSQKLSRSKLKTVSKWAHLFKEIYFVSFYDFYLLVWGIIYYYGRLRIFWFWPMSAYGEKRLFKSFRDVVEDFS